MSHAVMPLSDYVGACDAIREKTGGTEPIKSGELVEQIGAVHTAGKLAALESAEVLQGKLFGNPVTATAVTPIEHNTGVRLESKNLFDASLFNKDTAGGITVEHEGDGVFHIYGSTPANSVVQDKVCWLDLPCEANKNYTLSATLLSGTLGHFVIPFFGVGAEPHTIKNWLNVEINQNTEIGTTVTHTGKPSETGALHGFEANYITRFWFYFGVNTDPYEMDCRIRVQLELGSTATPYTPYVSDFSSAVVKKRGKNLFDKDNVTVVSTNAGGAYEMSPTETGVNIKFGLSGWPYVGASIGKYRDFVGKTLCFKCDCEGTQSSTSMGLYRGPENSPLAEFGSKNYCAATIPQNDTLNDVDIYLRLYAGEQTAETKNNTYEFKNIQVELGSTATEYEPYIPPITYSADAEGNLGEVPSISPTMILECPDVEGVNIVAHYLKDIDGAFEERLAELEAAVVENA